jgi:hypothetical protein
MIAADRITETAQTHGWHRLDGQPHGQQWARGVSRLHVGLSATGRTVEVAGYSPEGSTEFVTCPRPYLSVGGSGDPRGKLDAVLEWLTREPTHPRGGGAFIVIACGAEKLDHLAPAGDMYCSPHFQLSLKAARTEADQTGAQVAILSARYGLLYPEDPIRPYQLRMGEPGSFTARQLAEQLRRREVRAITALLPGRYLEAVRQAAAILEIHGTTVSITDLYAGAAGIGYQRAILSALIRQARAA